MSKIKIKQVDADTVCVSISNDTPISMVNELTKSLTSKGMVEDLAKSTISSRYFYRYVDTEVDDVAEQLIKSLQDMTKADDHTKRQWEAQAQGRLAQRNMRRKSLGLSPITREQMQNPKAASVPIAPKSPPPAQTGPATLPGVPNKLVDIRHNYSTTATNYGKIKKADEDDSKKSNKSAELTARLQNRSLNKAWGQHLPFPSAEEEIMKFAEVEKLNGESVAANQLVKLMAGKSMLGVQPPPQPTDEEMFGGGVVTEEMAKAAQNKWNNTLNNWLTEASKPIAQKFNSEEEELAYWNSIKVNDRDDGSSGY